MTGTEHKGRSFIRKIPAVIIPLLTVTAFFAGTLFADGTITLSLSAANSDVSPGDTVVVNLYCDEFDSIVRFGPVEVVYDVEQFEFVSVTAADILSGYDVTTDVSDDGIITISGEFIEATDEESGNVLAPVDTDISTMLFQISLRVRSDASGDTSVRIGSVGEFIRSDGAAITAYSSEELDINIVRAVSTDATLASLAVNGVTMTPGFSPQVYEYSANVSREVTSVSVNAIPNNLESTVSITGTDELVPGENIISVRVLAPDGISSKEYKIFVNRQEGYVPEGSGFVDSQGVTYTFMSFPSNLTVPDGFIQTTKTINGYTVPVFARDGISSVLVYVYNGTDSPALYFYNASTGIATVYRPEQTVVSAGRVLTLAQVPEDIRIPGGFTEGTSYINGVDMEGYTDADGNFLAYYTDDSGNGSFYLYDEKTDTFYEYMSVEKSAENLYRALFYVFIALSVIQSTFIVILVYVIRRIITNRTNPRPKRV